MNMLKQGEHAPDFLIPTDLGTFDSKTHRPFVLFFYPKDMTPGCTTEAKDFSALYANFKSLGYDIIGVSKDSISRHAKFREKQSLIIPLGSDEEGDLCERFGVWQEKKLYGKSFMGIVRSTFIMGADGRILHVWPKVKVNGHAAEVLETAKKLA